MATSIEPMYKGVVGYQASFLASEFHAGTDTSLTVLDASAFPPAPNYVTVRMATRSSLVTIQYTAISGDTLSGITVIEADSTTGLTATYPAGSPVYWSLSKKLLDSIINNITTLAESGGGGGTTDYTQLSNKPSIAGITLIGNKTLSDLGAAASSELTVEATMRSQADLLIQNQLTTHSSDISNPHSVTKSQIGLGNVDNTSDAAKPVSAATQTALDAKLDVNQGAENAGKIMKVGADGVLIPDEGGSGTIDYDDLINKPSIDGVTLAGSKSLADLGAAASTDLSAHVSSTENPHQVTKSQVGLANVDNTADADKPVSTATQTALNAKLNIAQGTENAGKVMTVGADGNLIPAAGGISEVAWGSITGDLGDQEDLQNALDRKVTSVEGKQLSSNDYSDAEKTKLEGIAAGAEVNTIDTVSIHGEALAISGKAVNIKAASKDEYGAVRIGNGITVADGVISVSSSGDTGIDAITVNGESIPVTDKVAAIPAVSAEKSGAMTPADKTKLDSVTSGAEPNVNADWNATEGDSKILNKPTINSKELSGNTSSEELGIVKNLTQSEYDALSEEEKNNGTIYCVTDAPGSGTTYASLPDKPSINSVTLTGNKTLADLGIVEKSTASTSAFQIGCDEEGAFMEIENT